MKLLYFSLRLDAHYPTLAFTIDWVNTLAQRVEEVHILTMFAGTYRVRENVRVYSVGKEKGYSEPRRVIEFYRHLTRILAHNRIDACFAHMNPLFAVMGAPLLKTKGIPITLWYTHKSVTSLLRIAERLVNRVVTASTESFRVPSQKVIVTGHGINVNHFIPTKHRPGNGPFIISCVGRLSPIKRVEVLIESVHHLVHDYNMRNFCVRIVGDATGERDRDYARSMRELATKLGLTSIVQFVGAIPFAQVVEEYQKADIVVNLSDTDSVDKAVLEAMSCAVPVVTSNISFRSIMGARSETCMIPKNNASCLANRLYVLRQQLETARWDLGQQLRELVVREHSLDNLADRLVHEILIS